jgi:hypothetical protein
MSIEGRKEANLTPELLYIISALNINQQNMGQVPSTGNP